MMLDSGCSDCDVDVIGISDVSTGLSCSLKKLDGECESTLGLIANADMGGR